VNPQKAAEPDATVVASNISLDRTKFFQNERHFRSSKTITFVLAELEDYVNQKMLLYCGCVKNNAIVN